MRYRFTVIQRGQIKDREIIALRAEYVKRFRRFGDLEIKESKKPKWPDGAIKVLLSEFGKTPSSEEFAKQVAKWTEHHGPIAFAVGDAYGHDEAFAKQADYQLALGPMTFPHQIAHLMLIEQCYRAATINASLPYHHGKP